MASSGRLGFPGVNALNKHSRLDAFSEAYFTQEVQTLIEHDDPENYQGDLTDVPASAYVFKIDFSG